MFHRQLQSILDLRGYARTDLPPSIDVSGPAFSAKESRYWRSAEIEPTAFFLAELDLALSSLLIAERDRNGPGQACAVSRFYLQRARERPSQGVFDQRIDRALEARRRGVQEQVEAR